MKRFTCRPKMFKKDKIYDSKMRYELSLDQFIDIANTLDKEVKMLTKENKYVKETLTDKDKMLEIIELQFYNYAAKKDHSYGERLLLREFVEYLKNQIR